MSLNVNLKGNRQQQLPSKKDAGERGCLFKNTCPLGFFRNTEQNTAGKWWLSGTVRFHLGSSMLGLSKSRGMPRLYSTKKMLINTLPFNNNALSGSRRYKLLCYNWEEIKEALIHR